MLREVEQREIETSARAQRTQSAAFGPAKSSRLSLIAKRNMARPQRAVCCSLSRAVGVSRSKRPGCFVCEGSVKAKRRIERRTNELFRARQNWMTLQSSFFKLGTHVAIHMIIDELPFLIYYIGRAQPNKKCTTGCVGTL